MPATWRTKPDCTAECLEPGCPWPEQFARNALALAAQHHNRTGHEVRAERSVAYYFGERR